MTAADILCSLEEPLSTVKGLGSGLTWLLATGVIAALFFTLDIPWVALGGPAISVFDSYGYFQKEVNRVDR